MIHAIAKQSHSQTPESGVEAFVARHQAGVWRYLRALGCEAARAEEHSQDALLAALHHDVHELAHVEASRWLRKAAKNLYLMELRKEKRRPMWVDLDEVDAAWSAMRGDEDGGSAALTRLNRCLLTLTPRDRELIARRYEQQEPRGVIANAFGIGEAGVKQALRRVRDKLRDCVLSHVSAPTNDRTTS